MRRPRGASPSARSLRVTIALLGALLMAPTVGDTGSCGRTAAELDRDRYARARKREDCARCVDCALETARCDRACDPKVLPDIALPATCFPLYHDGEVCLRVLEAASCEAYATYVDDEAPATPSECDFCRVAPAASPAEAPSFGDAGQVGDGAAP